MKIKLKNILVLSLIAILTIIGYLVVLTAQILDHKQKAKYFLTFKNETNYYDNENIHTFFQDGNHHYEIYDEQRDYFGDYDTFRKIKKITPTIKMFNNDQYGLQIITVTRTAENAVLNIKSTNGIKATLYLEEQNRNSDRSYLKENKYYFNDHLQELENGDAIELSTIKVFGLELTTTSDLQKGPYSLNIDFVTKNKTIKNKVNILSNGVELTDKPNTITGSNFFYNPVSYYNSDLSFMDKTYQEYQTAALNKIRELQSDFINVGGCNMFPEDEKDKGLNNGTITGMVKGTKTIDGNWNFDFTVLDNYLEFVKGLGFKNIFVNGIMIPESAAYKLFGYFDEATGEYTVPTNDYDSDEYLTATAYLLQAMSDHYKDSDFASHLYLALDEPSSDIAASMLTQIEENDTNNVFKTAIFAGGKYTLDYNDQVAIDFAANNFDYYAMGVYSLLNFGSGNDLKNRVLEFVQKRKTNDLLTYVYATASGKAPSTIMEMDPGESMYGQIVTAMFSMDGEYEGAFDKFIGSDMYDPETYDPSVPQRIGDSFKFYPKKFENNIAQPGLDDSMRSMQMKNGYKLGLKISYIKNNNPNLYKEILNNGTYYNQDNYENSRDSKYLGSFTNAEFINKSADENPVTEIVELEELINENYFN